MLNERLCGLLFFFSLATVLGGVVLLGGSVFDLRWSALYFRPDLILTVLLTVTGFLGAVAGAALRGICSRLATLEDTRADRIIETNCTN